MKTLLRLAALLFASLFASLLAVTAAEVTKLTPAEAAQQVAAGQAVLVDVREPSEWAEAGVAAPAVLLPKSDFDGEKKQSSFTAAPASGPGPSPPLWPPRGNPSLTPAA